MDRERQKAVIAHAINVTGGKERRWLRSFLFLLDMQAFASRGESITGAHSLGFEFPERAGQAFDDRPGLALPVAITRG